MVVLAVLTQMVSDVIDPVRQKRNLHFRRARVAIMTLVLFQDFFFIAFVQLLPRLASKKY